jgi:hypothetical protein
MLRELQEDLKDAVLNEFSLGLRSQELQDVKTVYVNSDSLLHISVEEIIVGINLECCRYYKRNFSSFSRLSEPF